jgi:hypothetical protein
VRQYTNPKDAAFQGVKGALVRKVGKRRRATGWKRAAVAKLAPDELDGAQEADIRAQVLTDVEATGLPFLTLEDGDLGWLKQLAPTNYHAARLLDALKDLPDVLVWRPAPGMPYALSLPLELKKQGRGGRPGQRAFRDSAGGFITQGYTPAKAALQAFLEAPAPRPPGAT